MHKAASAPPAQAAGAPARTPAQEEKAQINALRELVQSDEPTEDDTIIALRAVRDQVRAEKAARQHGPPPQTAGAPTQLMTAKEIQDAVETRMAHTTQLLTVRPFFLEWTHEQWPALGRSTHKLRKLFKPFECNMDFKGFQERLTGIGLATENIDAIVRAARYFFSMLEMPPEKDPLILVRTVSNLLGKQCFKMQSDIVMWFLSCSPNPAS